MSKSAILRYTAKANGWQRTLFQPQSNKSMGQTYAAHPMPAKAPYDTYEPIHPPQFKLSAINRLELGGIERRMGHQADEQKRTEAEEEHS